LLLFLLQYGQTVGTECPLVVVAGEGGVHAIDGWLPGVAGVYSMRIIGAIVNCYSGIPILTIIAGGDGAIVESSDSAITKA